MKNTSLLLNAFFTLVSGALIGGILIGAFAFLVAGTEGVLNGLVFGAALGAVASVGLMSTVNFTNFWTGYSKRIGRSHIDKESGN